MLTHYPDSGGDDSRGGRASARASRRLEAALELADELRRLAVGDEQALARAREADVDELALGSIESPTIATAAKSSPFALWIVDTFTTAESIAKPRLARRSRAIHS